MTTDPKSLGKLLDASGLMARKQDNKILVYNRTQKFLSRGVLVEDLNAAERLVRQYIRYIQTSGFVPLTEFAAEHQYRPVPYQEVDNKVDDSSAYYVNKSASLSLVSRINLLLAARALEERAETMYLLRTAEESINASSVSRHHKLKKIARLQFDS